MAEAKARMSRYFAHNSPSHPLIDAKVEDNIIIELPDTDEENEMEAPAAKPCEYCILLQRKLLTIHTTVYPEKRETRKRKAEVSEGGPSKKRKLRA
jgi:hypothetical protein